MTNSEHIPLQQLRFFLTRPHDCSYLAEHEATTLFLDPEVAIDDSLYASLTLLGFRRSGAHLYRPHCRACSACQSVRIPVDAFRADRTQRRIELRNRDLSVTERPAHFEAEHYALFERYIRERHADGDMYPASEAQYRAFLINDSGFSQLVEFRHEGQLLAVAAVDRLPHGLSAIYTFFDPDSRYKGRSLGSYAILWQIARARELGLPHLYLGYWIRDSRKMAYKTRFQPLEHLDQHRWQRLDREAPSAQTP
ncbi:arginyltransferase [Kushneria aurantia]|uniref:Aspartate/glutamate leucyltransferase n=1 Tax=Kushneria aurantia TaxID=504092 RepID=A0ABV6G4E6_9GAMM